MCGIVAILNVKEHTQALRKKVVVDQEQSQTCLSSAKSEKLLGDLRLKALHHIHGQ